MMESERQGRKKAILKTVRESYNLEWCRWRVLSSQPKKKKEIFNPNTKGYIHGAVILKNSLYAFFGPDETKSSAPMYSYNLRNNEWKQWRDCNMPESRDSFGLTVHQNEIYMFGGSSYDTQYGDLNAFNTMSSTWQPVPSSNPPSPRNPLVFTDINNQCIFLYGGINLETAEIANDAYIFFDKEWEKVTRITNSPKNLVGAHFAVCNENVYLFGGEYEDEQGVVRASLNLYRIQIKYNENSINFEVVCGEGKGPCGRTGHSMIGVSKDYLMLIGGQSIASNKMLRDIWLFDLEMATWLKIDPVNGPLRPMAENSLVLHNGSVLILGGLTDHENMWNERIIALQFGESEPSRNEICTNCIQRSILKDKQEKAFPKTLVLSSGFFYTISLEIKHPFQAIQLLYECALELCSTDFHISIEKALNDSELIQIGFNGESLSKCQFQQLICHTNAVNEEFSKFMTNLKIASLRLGKTLVFITANELERKVFLFSADSKVAPSFDENYVFFAYAENIKKGTVESHEGKTQRQLILNVLRSRLANPQTMLNITSLNRILIFQKNILVTSDKLYYYELIASNDDINIYKSAKKLQFLEELGYPISKQPEISLRSYLSIMRLKKQKLPDIFINNSQDPVIPVDYLENLKFLEKQGQIQQFEMASKFYDVEVESFLYIAQKDNVINNNLGLLIYLEGRLINRFSDTFGELFKEEFYKTRFKKAHTIFQFLGVINIKKGLSINYFGSWFKKNRNYYLFIDTLSTAMRKAKVQKVERQMREEIDVIEDSKARKLRL